MQILNIGQTIETVNDRQPLFGKADNDDQGDLFERVLADEKGRHESDTSKQPANIAASKEASATDDDSDVIQNGKDKDSKRIAAGEGKDSDEKHDTSSVSDDTDIQPSRWHDFLKSVHQSIRRDKTEDADLEKSIEVDQSDRKGTMPLFGFNPVEPDYEASEDGELKKQYSKQGDMAKQSDIERLLATQSKRAATDSVSADHKVSDTEASAVNVLLSKLENVDLDALSDDDAAALKELKLLLSKASAEPLSDADKERVGALLLRMEQLPASSGAGIQTWLTNLLNKDESTTAEKALFDSEPLLAKLQAAWDNLSAEVKSTLESAVSAHLNGDSSELVALMEQLGLSTTQQQDILDSRVASPQLLAMLAVLQQDTATERQRLGQSVTPVRVSSNDSVLSSGNSPEKVEVSDARTAVRSAEAPNPTAIVTSDGKTLTPAQAVMAAFRAAADETRQAMQGSPSDTASRQEMQESGRSGRLVEALLGNMSPVTDAPRVQAAPAAFAAMTGTTTTTMSTTMTMTQQNAALLNQQAQAVAETPFEQARQTQQYIELFGPQAPRQLRDQIAVMYNNRHQFAEMRLDPPELGRLQIRVQFNGDQQASVTFNVSSPQAREAVEQALPRLREMLEEQGIQLAESHVREDAERQANNQQGNSSGGDGSGAGANDDTVDDRAPLRQQIIDVENGRVDYYA